MNLLSLPSTHARTHARKHTYSLELDIEPNKSARDGQSLTIELQAQ